MKKLALLVAAALMCASMAACGSSSSSSGSASASAESSASASASASTEATASGEETTGDTLIMGTNAAFPPYEYYEGDQIVGIDADIAKALGDKLGMEVTIEDMDFNSLITAVQTGKIDMVLAGMTVTPDREEKGRRIFPSSTKYFFAADLYKSTDSTSIPLASISLTI